MILLQISLVLMLVSLLIFYLLVVYSTRRARVQTGVPIPVSWKWMMLITFLVILFSILFILFVKP